LKKIIVAALMALVFVAKAPIAGAQNTAQSQAEILLNTAGVAASLEQSIEQMLQFHIQQNADLLPYKGVMQDFFSQYMGYESLKPDLIKLYTDAFTEAELKDINAFYSTTTGQKTLQAIPQLMVQGAQLGAQRVQDNLQELDAMIANEAERLKEDLASSI